MKLKLLFIATLLFAVFGLYRLHFWDYEFHTHIVFNALADTAFALGCGALLFTLGKRITRWWQGLSYVLLIVLCSLGLYGAHYLIYSAMGIMNENFAPMFHALCFQLLDSGSIVIIGALTFLLTSHLSEKERIHKRLIEMSIAKDQEELKYLKTKINPHFIFNGLNSIYHEVDANAEQAKSRILQFSEIVRYHLNYASFDKVDFKTECQYLQAYIDFKHNSTSDFIELNQNIRMSDEQVEIAPLLLLPFVENAFKYCSAKGKERAQMKVDIDLSKKCVALHLENSYDPGKRSQIKSHQIGIKNALKRLEHYYSKRYQLDISDESGWYQCNLNIAL